MAMLAFSIAGFLSLYALQRLQDYAAAQSAGLRRACRPTSPSTPRSASSPTPTGRTTRGETTMSHLTQMLGLTVHNFLSAATGLAMAFALVRAFARSTRDDGRQFLGRYDPRRRSTCCCRCRSSSRWSSSRSACRRRSPARSTSTTLEGAKQTISLGPMASQEAIKELGTNGGGFFNANSAHPFENPNAWSNMLEIWSLLLVSVRLRHRLRPRGRRRHARAARSWSRWAILLVAGVGVVYWAETRRQSAADRARRRSRRRQSWKARKSASARR